ncbi:MAG TPA: glycosyltransferase [Chitinophagaceae bacterium]|nr:glycosyltransferase [Chitinophagaceae bacterium]
MRKSLRLPLFHMNIAVSLPLYSETGSNPVGRFIVETSFFLIREHSDHKFIIIIDKTSPLPPLLYSNTETILVKPLSKNALLKKIWWAIKLPAILKKAKADLFISFQDACSPGLSIPQCLFIQDKKEAKKTYIKKAQLLLVTNTLAKTELIESYGIPEKKITIIYPGANEIFEPIHEEEKATIKNRYSEGKEFFLFNSIFPGHQAFIDLLKSFSHFKKRQQSNFKLLLATPINSFFEKSLVGYRYRNDVTFIDINDKPEEALITASAYAVVLPFNTNENLIAALNTMRSGVPVIAVKKSAINEVAKDAALYAETETTKDVGEKMIQVYTDESCHFKLIEKGKQVAATYTNEKAAKILWQSILKVLE